MWNRLSIRAKITLLTAAVLCVISLVSFVFNIENASTIFIIPDNIKIPLDNEEAFQFDFEVAQEVFRINSFYVMVICSIAGTALMWWVSGKVLKPLNSFSTKIKDLDINKINEDIHLVKTEDEVGDLQKAFNYMLKNIRDSYDSQKRFSQNAAHELKTPVAAIKANLEVLNIGEEPGIDEYKEFTQVVDRQITIMNAIVQGLRMLSSGENLNIEKIQLQKIIKEILFDLEDRINDKQQRVEVLCDNENVFIEGDKILIKQGIFNVIHNAVRYSGLRAKIEIRLEEKFLSVRNYGVGISGDNLEKIFEAFYCVDKSRSKKYGGSGLGLAITKEIIERHGFSITANSVDDSYTEFIIDFGGERKK